MILWVVRYVTADVLRSQRLVAPALAYATVLAVFFGGDPGAPPTAWIASSLALYPIGAWCAIVIANCEEPVQRTITIVAAGGWGRLLAGLVAVCVLADIALGALAVLWPMMVTAYPYGWSTIVLGLLVHLASALTGTAVGLLCARPVIHSPSVSLCVVVGVVALTAVQRWLPPVGSAVAALGKPASEAIPVLALDVAVAVALRACW